MFKLQALIFDVDGTLAETEELHRSAFNASFAKAGLGWTWTRETYAELLEVTGGKERLKHYDEHCNSCSVLDDQAIAALHRDKTAHYMNAIQDGHLALRPGIERLIREAQAADLRLAIATTTSRPNVDTLLHAALGCNPFDIIVAGDDVPAKKPAPDVYLLALTRLGLPADACLALEDTMNGLRSATGAGIQCVITTSVYGGCGSFPGAIAVVDCLGDPQQPATVLDGPKISSPIIGIAELNLLRSTNA